MITDPMNSIVVEFARAGGGSYGKCFDNLADALDAADDEPNRFLYALELRGVYPPADVTDEFADLLDERAASRDAQREHDAGTRAQRKVA